MVKIYKGEMTLTVPNGSYEKQFKPNGWSKENSKETIGSDIMSEETMRPETPETTEEIPEENQEDEWDEEESIESDLEEKPLSEMNREELLEFARIKGINVEGLGKNVQIREAIKATLSK